jgi:hypothetical protein
MSTLVVPTSIDTLLIHDAIRQTLLRYCRGVDRREWSLVAASYHDDAFDDHGGYKGGLTGLLTWLERRHATIEQSMHFLGNCLIDVRSRTEAVAETYCMVYQRYGEEARETIQTWLGDEPLAPGERLMAELLCRYVDLFELRDNTWRIARRTVVMEEVKVTRGALRLRQGYAVARRDQDDALWHALGHAHGSPAPASA